MPPITLTLRQRTSPITDGTDTRYRVLSEVTAASGMSAATFVFRVTESRFSHYASPADLETYPASRELAVVAGVGFFRQAVLDRSWGSVAEMQEDVSTTRRRLHVLVREVERAQEGLTTDQTIVLGGS